MKLDRNGEGGLGKYALVKMRRVNDIRDAAKEPVTQTPADDRRIIEAQHIWEEIHNALHTLQAAGVLEYCRPNTEGEFFVIRFRDKHAYAAMQAYAQDVKLNGDFEYAKDLRELLPRTGIYSRFCKAPD